MNKKTTCWAVLIYGFLIIALGCLGYFKGASPTSLYMGAGLGALLVLCSIFMFCQFRFGSYAALLLTLALTGTFAIRYSMTHKEVPAILAVLSGGMLLYLLTRVVHWRR